MGGGRQPSTIDQDLPPFVIAEGGRPLGTVEDGDAVVFFNFRGNRSSEIDGETWQDVPSDVVPFEQRPWMKAVEITDAVDLALGRLLAIIDAAGGVALVTADHGNADEMYELDKKTGQPKTNKDGSYKAKTAHTLNPVPLILPSTSPANATWSFARKLEAWRAALGFGLADQDRRKRPAS